MQKLDPHASTAQVVPQSRYIVLAVQVAPPGHLSPSRLDISTESRPKLCFLFFSMATLGHTQHVAAAVAAGESCGILHMTHCVLPNHLRYPLTPVDPPISTNHCTISCTRSVLPNKIQSSDTWVFAVLCTYVLLRWVLRLSCASCSIKVYTRVL